MTMSDERYPTRSDCPVDQLPWLANGKLDADERAVVETHLAGCAACQADLRAWAEVRQAVRRAGDRAPTPRADLFALVERRINRAPDLAPAPETGAARITRALRAALAWRIPIFWLALRIGGQHIAAQTRLIRRELFWMPLIIAPLIVAMLYLPGPWSRTPGAAALVAALVTALGMALLYGQRVDSAREIALATPTSPRVVLGIRCSVVFGYDLLLNCGLILPLLAWRGVLTPAWFLSHWLAPLCCLSAIALLLSVALNANTAMLVCAALWALRVFDGAQSLFRAGPPTLPLALWQQSYEGFWSQGSLLFLITALAVGLAFVLLERRERYAWR